MQVALQILFDGSPGEERLLFTNNYYKRNYLASQVQSVTDSRTKLLSTVCFNVVDDFIKLLGKKAIEQIKAAPGGLWRIVQAFDVPRKGSKPPKLAENGAVLVLKDRNKVIFYTSDLAKTPTQGIHDQNDDQAIYNLPVCVC